MDDDTAKLERAARGNDLDTVKHLIGNQPVSAAEKTLTHLAAEKGNLQVLVYLGGRNSTLPEWTRRDFESEVVHTAIEAAQFPVVKHFIEEEKVDVDIANEFGETPIFTALRSKQNDIFKYLVEERKANLTATDARGNNILYVAVKTEDAALVRYILDERKAPLDVNGRNKVGDTVLHAAILAAGSKQYDSPLFNWRKGIKLIEDLVKVRHADVNAVGNHGKTPLHVAALLSHLKICNLLMDHGADPKIRDGGGHNYWEIAGFRKRHIRSVPALVDERSGLELRNSLERGIHDETASIDGTGAEAFYRNHFSNRFNTASWALIAQLLFKDVRRSYMAPGRFEYSAFLSPQDVVRRKMDPVALDAVHKGA